MNAEKRTIKASLLTGVTDIIMGIIFYFIGFSTWYYNHFHVFGIFGISLIVYSFWHYILLKGDTDGR